MCFKKNVLSSVTCSWNIECESVSLDRKARNNYLPKDHQLAHSQKSHVRWFRIEPSHMGKTTRCKLQDGSLDFTTCCGYVSADNGWVRTGLFFRNGSSHWPNASPFVLSHFENFANFQTAPDAKTVAQHNVQNQSIPPAFDKIRQQMCESDFGYFPHYWYGPQDAHVSDQNRLKCLQRFGISQFEWASNVCFYLEHPSQVMSNSEYINMRPHAVKVYVRAVDPVLLCYQMIKNFTSKLCKSHQETTEFVFVTNLVHVDMKIFQLRIEPVHDVHDTFVILEHKKLQE